MSDSSFLLFPGNGNFTYGHHTAFSKKRKMLYNLNQRSQPVELSIPCSGVVAKWELPLSMVPILPKLTPRNSWEFLGQGPELS
jgi:hypothetical protein